MFCSPSLLGILFHFTGSCSVLVCCSQSWSWFLQACIPGVPQNKPLSLLDPTHSSTGIEDMALSAGHNPTLALGQGILQAQGRRQWQVLVFRTFLHPCVHKKGRFWTQVQQGLSVRHVHNLPHLRKMTDCKGGQAVPPTKVFFLPSPSSSSAKITSSSHSWLRLSPTLYFPNGPGAQMGPRR